MRGSQLGGGFYCYKFWVFCGTDGLSGGWSVYGHVITKFSRIGRLLHFATPSLVSPRSHIRLKFYGWLVITQIRVVLPICWSKFSRHFARKPVAASRDVGCFLNNKKISINHFCFQLYVPLFFRTHLCSVDRWSLPQREIKCTKRGFWSTRSFSSWTLHGSRNHGYLDAYYS